MKTNHYRHLVVLFLLAASATRTASADPVGGQVVAGQATISSPASGIVNINQTSSRAIINWNSFSIAPGEVTTFIQPSANAAALNRVISDNPSLIYGSLQANGHVYLINQSGILVGPGGSVNTGSFTASTLDVSDKSFLSGGNLNFSGNSTAGVDNQGSIRALGGNVFLIANTVANSGSISAPRGTVGLAAGSSVQLLMSGQDKISVLAGNSSAPQAAVGVNNLGAIESATAELKAAGGNIYALAINNGGVVRATSLVNENGNIMLKSDGGNIANSGTLSANNANGSGGSVTLDGGHNVANPSTVVNTGIITARGDASGTMGGTMGGTVEMLGDHVGIFDQGLVDVSGDAGGGTALIGGSFQGKDASVQNADMTIVDPGAVIKADALTTGDGGKVVVWSDEATRFYGLISAQGGSLSGNGGNVEVSSHGNLDFGGNVTTLAANGKPGTLLLDPHDLIITNGGNSGGTNGASPTNDSSHFDDGGATVDSVINDGKLNNLLNSGSVILFANDDITFANNTSVTAAASSLTLRAGRSITLAGGGSGATIDLGTGSFTATFNDGQADATGRDPGAANFTMGQNSSITASGGILIQGGTLAADKTGSPTVTLAGNTGAITLTTLSTTPAAAGTAGDITVLNDAIGTPTLGKDITINNSGAGTAVTTAGPNTATPNGGTITMNADGVININGAVHSDGGSPGGGNPGGNAGPISFTAGNGIIVNNHKVTALGGAGTPAGSGGAITFTAASGGVTNSGANAAVSGDSLTLSGSGIFVLGSAGNDNINSLSGTLTSGSLTYVDQIALTVNSLNAGSAPINITTATGDLTVAGAVTTTGNATLTATAGNIAQSGAGKVSGNLVTLNADGANGTVTANTAATSLALAGAGTGAINVTEDDSVTVNSASTGSGAINITSTTGNLTVGGTVTTTGNATLTATAGNIAQSGTGKVSGNLVTLNADGANGSVNADTKATSLTLAGAGTGGITVTEDDGATINSATTGSGAIGITSTTGDLTVAGPVTTTGNATLTATAGNIAQSGTGKVSGNLVTLNADGANGSVTADTAATSLALAGAGTGAINVTEDDSVTVNSANTGSGTINITSTTGNLTVGGVVTTTGNATLTATAGNIAQSGTGKVSGNLVTLNADGANGTVTADTKATSLALAGAGTGAINVTEDDSVTVNSASTGSGDISITSTTGNLTVGGAVTTTGNDTLTATAGNIAQSGTGNVSGNLVTLNADGANGSVTADTAATSLALLGHGTGGIVVTEDDGATINSAATGSGTINITSTTGDLTVAGAVTTTGNATLTATAGNIAQSGTGKVSGNLVTLNADGVNGSVTADTAATSLALAGAGTGAINVTEDDSVTVNSAATGSGAINITSTTGNLTVATVTTSGNIQLAALSGSVLDDNNASTSIQSTAGTTTVTASGAGHNIGSVADPLDISSTGGAVLLDAQGGAVHMDVESAGDAEFTSSADNATFITTSFTQGGNTYTAKYTDLAGGNFTLLNNGNILDSAGVDVLAPLSTLTLQSTANPGGLGTLALPVLTTAATLNLTGAGPGAINVTESDGATVNSASTGSGDVNITSTTGNLTVDTAATSGNISLTSATGDLTVAGAVTTTGNDTLTATAGNILQSGTGKVSGNLVTLNAGGANGSVTANTAATSLTLAGAGTGGITVTEDDGATINSATTGGGTINITSTTGDLTVAGPVATTGNATLTATAGNIAQSGTGKVSGNLVTLNADGANGAVTADTAATSLALLGHGTGGITVTEDDGATINSAGTGSGAINITSTTGDLTVAGAVTTTGNATLTATAGNIAQSGTGKVSGDLVTLNADGANGSVTADTAATSLALTGAGTGAINVTEDDSVTVNSASTGSGNINIATTAGSLTVGGAVTTTGDAALQASGANQQLTVNGTGSVSGLTGVQLTADQITLQGPVSSGNARTMLQPLTAGRDIDLGTKTAGTLGLTDADLDEVTAGVLQVGNATAGAITISAPISPANAPVLALINNSSVTESLGATITEASLRISSPGPVTLDKANQVTNLAGAVSGPGMGFTFDNTGSLNVGTVDGVAGITTDNGPISVETANGALAVNNNVDAGTSVANSTVKLVAGSSGNDNLLSIGPGTTVQGLAGVTLVGDNISIDTSATPATVTAGTSRVTLKPFEAGTAINLGGPDGVGTLGITQAELSRVVTPGNTPGVVVQIGDLTSGDITVTGPISIDPGGLNPNPGSTSITAPRLNLVSGGNINETSGSITVPVLSLEAGGTISLTTPINNVNYLGSQSPQAKTPLHFVDIDTLLPAPGILDGQTLPGINPQPADVQGGGGGINVSTISVQLAGIAYVDIPVVKLSAANFTARVEGNPATILPPGSIATLGLTVPFPEEEDQQAPRRIEDRTKWVSGNMVVSGSTPAPQSSK